MFAVVTPTIAAVDIVVVQVYGILGVVLAICVAARMISERNTPGAIWGWCLFVIFMPYLGAPLYLLFGGRKSRHLIRKKRRANETREPLVAHQTDGVFANIEGNTTTLLANGTDTYEALIAGIRAAKRSIHIATYLLGKDAAGKAVIAELAKQAQAGVSVRLLLDGLYAGRIRWRAFTRPLVAAGGQVAVFIPVLPFISRVSINLRNHRKIAIFDGETAIVGGQNIERRFMAADPWQGLFMDFSVSIRGPAVMAFSETFTSDWWFATREWVAHTALPQGSQPPSAGSSSLTVIASGPDLEIDQLWEAITNAIYGARRSVTIVSPYVVPDDVLLQAIRSRLHRGVRVTIITPDTSNHFAADWARYRPLRILHDDGADIRFYRPGVLHGKLLIVDGQTAITGSMNMDSRSFFINFEIGIVHHAPDDVVALERWANGLLPDCVNYETSRWANPSKSKVALYDTMYLFSPML